MVKMLILPDNSDINYFDYSETGRSDNDSNNKIREKIIESMPHLDEDYFNKIGHHLNFNYSAKIAYNYHF